MGVARTEAERRVCELNQLTLPSFPLSSLLLPHIFELTLFWIVKISLSFSKSESLVSEF